MPAEASSIVWVVIIGTVTLLLLAGGLIGVVVIAKQRELKAKERQYEELAKSERKYRALFENSLAGIVRLSMQSLEVIDVNRALLNICKINSASEFRDLLKTIPSRDQEFIDQSLRSKGFFESLQTCIRRNDGSELWVLTSGIAFPAEGYIEAVFIDVTEKKLLEERNLRTQRVESIGVFASGIAHDMQNTLIPIKLSTDLLKRKVIDQQVLQVITSISNGVEHGLEMVKQMLAFVRGAEGTHVPLEYSEMVRRVVQSMQDSLPSSIQIRYSCDEPSVHIRGDLTQLRQVLVNLIMNARDAMPNGGTITVTTRTEEIHKDKAQKILNAREGKFIVCSIVDTGIGIPSEHIERIFEPFFTTKEVGKGTGLGLSVVLGIVKGHKGFLDVASEIGKGTTFSVYLPLEREG